jgi:hypothetical protein
MTHLYREVSNLSLLTTFCCPCITNLDGLSRTACSVLGLVVEGLNDKERQEIAHSTYMYPRSHT